MFKFLQSRSADKSSNMAKARLNNILISDRLRVTPEITEQIKKKIQESIGQYVEIGEEGIKLELNSSSGVMTLSTTVPVKQLKKR